MNFRELTEFREITETQFKELAEIEALNSLRASKASLE